jgi:hypothetical protein
MQSGTSTGRHSGTRFPEVCCRKDTKAGTTRGRILRFVKKGLMTQSLSAIEMAVRESHAALRVVIDRSRLHGRKADRSGKPYAVWDGMFWAGMAEKMGFEPTIPSRVYSLSRGAPSTTRPPLRSGLIMGKRYRWQGLLWKSHAIPPAKTHESQQVIPFLPLR